MQRSPKKSQAIEIADELLFDGNRLSAMNETNYLGKLLRSSETTDLARLTRTKVARKTLARIMTATQRWRTSYQ